jgi:hypothetical protein
MGIRPWRCIRAFAGCRTVWILAGLGLAAVASAKDTGTTCAEICDGAYTSTQCTVASSRVVAAGSNVDCGARVATIASGGELVCHDGVFTLRARSLTFGTGAKITTDCPTQFETIGFSVVVAEGVDMTASQAKMTARCEVGGGRVIIDAGGTVTIGALGIDVSGSGQDASGGVVQIQGGSNVSLMADIKANATLGIGAGGSIEAHSRKWLYLYGNLFAEGISDATSEDSGGEIVLDAAETITGTGELHVESARGNGGDISVRAGGTVSLSGWMKARGIGSSQSGGSVEIVGGTVTRSGNITVTGGQNGGTVTLVSRNGPVRVGTSSSTVTLDVSGDNGGQGGTLKIVSHGSDVVIGPNATLFAKGQGGAQGGLIELAGADVTTDAAATLSVNGVAPNGGGEINVEARDAMTLGSAYQANNDSSLFFGYRTGTPSIAGGMPAYELNARPELAAPCGDGILRTAANPAKTEQCEADNLNGQTCASLGLGSGTLACSTTCTFDASGCSGS